MAQPHPTLRHVLTRAAWYLGTFLLAVAINFVLPRLGDANPVDVMLARATVGLDAQSAKAKEEAYLKEFGLVEVDAGRSAPLRGWVRLDPSVQPGTMPIDRLGLAILKVEAGERLEIRRIATNVAPVSRFAEAAE